MVGILLDVFGYKANVVQSASSIFGIQLLMGPITAVFIIIANCFLFFYPIDKKQYQEIQKGIAEMEAKK